MHLKRLQITDFRNLKNAELTPATGVNLITGKNASGKTSLLEAIYYLSHARSFRSQQVADLINRDADYLQLVANIKQSNIDMQVGMRRSKTRMQIRCNQQPVRRVADLAASFPVLAIHPDSYRLITGSPAERRQYLDWGVFHVEQGFFDAWQRYRKALSQRNAALRQKQAEKFCILWDREISASANHIDTLRQAYFDKLQPYFDQLVERFFANEDVAIEYRRGWGRDKSLIELLAIDLEKDRRQGFTYYGPHRAEIAIKVQGQSAQTGISRGQQKLLVALLRLAQAQQFTAMRQQSCVLLYDDLAAELDENNRGLILAVLANMRVQLFVTAIEAGQIDLTPWQHKKMFHVEQGQLKDLI
jgi:DNA replication and repair protein RecF